MISPESIGQTTATARAGRHRGRRGAARGRRAANRSRRGRMRPSAAVSMRGQPWPESWHPPAMHHILLLGAGFSRNYGGWLADELTADLMGRVSDDRELLKL